MACVSSQKYTSDAKFVTGLHSMGILIPRPDCCFVIGRGLEVVTFIVSSVDEDVVATIGSDILNRIVS